jgi:serine/threonine-protein kinase
MTPFVANGMYVIAQMMPERREADPPQWHLVAIPLAVSFLSIGLAIWVLRRRFLAKKKGSLASFCPDPIHWKELLIGQLPEGQRAALHHHLESCSRCQRRLDELVAGKDLWSGVARQLRDEPQPPGPGLKRVVDDLKKFMDDLKKEANLPPTSEELKSGDEASLSFLAPPNKPGQLGRLGSYEVLEVIGRGGMGVVLKALDPSLQRAVAIKVLAPQLATSGVARKRFTREAQAAAAINHEHVVTIHAVDEANGLPYLVMQFVPGMSLQDRIDRNGPLELKEILRISMQTAAGLAAAHAQGLIHRDIKPANILLENGVRRVKITDFGLARAADDAGFTQSGVVAGTPQYMAPEQARGETLDHRADLFSLGSTMYAMCTGRPPFRATTNMGVLKRVSDEPPPPIRDINPDIPTWLVAIIEKLHAKNPANRFQTAAEVSDLLGQHLARLQQPAVPDAADIVEKMPSTPPESAPPQPPITSLTVCPSCGASLHVPENLVGKTVYCVECGNPLRPENTSEEMHVVHAVRPAPFAARSGVRSQKGEQRSIGWIMMLGFVLVLLLGVGLLFMLPMQSSKISHDELEPHQATVGIGIDDNNRFLTVEDVLPYKGLTTEALSWFPASATFFGVIDFRAFGSLKLEQDFVRAVIDKLAPPEVVEFLSAKDLSDVRLDRVSFAYQARTEKSGDSRFYVRLTGSAAYDYLLARFRQQMPGLLPQDQQWPSGERISLIRSPAALAAFAICGDTDLIVAGFSRAGADHLEVVKQTLNVRAGYEPSIPKGPLGREWKGLVAASPAQGRLSHVPVDSWALVMGELPPELKKVVSRSILPEAPNYVFGYLLATGYEHAVRKTQQSTTIHRQNTGGTNVVVDVPLAADLEFRTEMNTAAGAKELVKLPAQALKALAHLPPGVKLTPQAVGRLTQLLRHFGLQQGVVISRVTGMTQVPLDGVVSGQAHIPVEVWQDLAELVKQLPVSWPKTRELFEP